MEQRAKLPHQNAPVKTDSNQFDAGLYAWRDSVGGADKVIEIDGNDRQLPVLGATGIKNTCY